MIAGLWCVFLSIYLTGGMWWQHVLCAAAGLGLIVVFWPYHTLMQGGKPYLTRWPLLGGDGAKRAPWPLGLSQRNVFIHWIRASDGPAVHNHPYAWCWSFLLWGSYLETRVMPMTPGFDTERVVSAGQTNRISDDIFHTLRLVTPSVWSVFVTGPKHGGGWGFLVDGEFIPANSERGKGVRENHGAKESP